jgi:two-component system NarL family sensor kinase
MKNISITEKLIFFFMLIGIVAIIAIGSYSYYFAKKALLDRAFDQLISLRLEKKNRIEQFFLDRDRDINLISKSEEIKKIIDVLNSKEKSVETINKFQHDSYLNKYISSYGYYKRLHVVSQNDFVFDINSSQPELKKDSVIYSVSDQNLKNFCKEIELSKKIIIQDLSKAKLLIYIGTPIFNEVKNIIGFVVMEIPVTAINKIMFGYTENNGLGKTGETYLVGNDYLMRSNSRFKENAVFNIKVASESVINAFNGKTGADIVKDYRNISCLSSYSKVNIEGLNWVILAEIDEQEAMIPVNSIRNSILLISLIIAASVFLFAFLISREITLPLKKLQKASEQIGAGNYDVNLKVSSRDEIGSLTETFNNMTLQLKKQSEQIEVEKTKKVSSLIDGQEMERQRLSRDLHDSLGQSLLAVKIKLEQTKSASVEKNQQIINETQELLRETIQEIRNISNDLMPPVLEAFGLEQGLKNLCKDTTHNTGINVHFTSENIPDTLDKRVQIYLYRISQEAINNITKHSAANEASIKISSDQNIIFLNIADNGKGFDSDKIEISGNGIMNIKQRVELLKGECLVSSSLGEGTQIKIKIPVN